MHRQGDAIDIQRKFLSNDRRGLRCVSSSMGIGWICECEPEPEPEPEPAGRMFRPVVASCCVGGRSGRRRAWFGYWAALLGRRGCGVFAGLGVSRRAGFGDWIGSVTGRGGAERGGSQLDDAPFAALDRPFALRPSFRLPDQAFWVRQERRGEERGGRGESEQETTTCRRQSQSQSHTNHWADPADPANPACRNDGEEPAATIDEV
jgi:hypothetical protein